MINNKYKKKTKFISVVVCLISNAAMHLMRPPVCVKENADIHSSDY